MACKWYFTVTLDPYLFGVYCIGFLIKAAKSLIYSYPPECSQVVKPNLGILF